MDSRFVQQCPKCGSDEMEYEVVMTYPEKYRTRCTKCLYHHDVDGERVLNVDRTLFPEYVDEWIKQGKYK